MKRIELGQTLSTLANFGVIAGIIFLAFELQQNNELLEAQTSYAQFSVERDRRSFLIQDAGLVDLYVKASSGAALTDSERFRLSIMNNDALDTYRWQFRELQAGWLPDDYLDLRIWRDVWRSVPGLYELFQEDRPRLEPDFVRFIEENVGSER